MTLGELLAELDEVGVVKINGSHEPPLNEWLDQRGVDPETPIPTWNVYAQAWEV